jgi:hypothetical protein
MTCQALGRLSGRPDVQYLADALGNVVLKHAEGAGMLVLRDPDCVFVLKDVGGAFRLHAAMATAGRTTAGTIVLTSRDRFLIEKRGRGESRGSLGRQTGIPRSADGEQRE